MTLLASAGTGGIDLPLLGVLLAVAGFLTLAHRTGLPYPILLVVGGVALGLVPGIPDVELDPDLVLVIFLPPLLYAAAFFSSLHELRDNLRPIGLLAIGLVTFTTLVVGVVAHAVIPALSWPAAFTLGAVLSPTDPIAATAIASRVGAPRRFVTIIEGESLINDATALTLYKVAVAATLSGSFSIWHAAGSFVLSSVAGILIGAAIGWLLVHVRRATEDTTTEITISLLTPYFAYLPAEALGASAVLAAVTAGIWIGWRAPGTVDPTTRLQAFSFWETLSFMLNAALFILLGIQLPGVLSTIRGDYAPATLALYAGVVVATVIAVRMLWVFPADWLSRALSPTVRDRDADTHWHETFLVGFTGMRGAVSLAAALAIPATTDAGQPFPGRELIIFLVYAVILVTLVAQGLALPGVIRRLGIAEEHDDEGEDEARLRAAKAALQRIDDLAGEDWVRERTAERMRRAYEFRVRRFGARLDDDEDHERLEEGSQAYQRLRREVLEAERSEIISMREQGLINDDVMHRIERDLDLEDARLEI
ncbi:MAG: monovalent cation/hydrogen antiporter [Solirubrobacteraceae bacterium]|nr:monovalent cation/hydrogen antiporter [Solirubrobacteraceae bacterium]